MEKAMYAAGKKPTPKVDALELLLAVFSVDQLIQLGQEAALIAQENGPDTFADLTVRFHGKVPRRIGREMWKDIHRGS